ncbi:MAG: S46 family peptidase, partial [Ignavibacteriaceae bacterium]
ESLEEERRVPGLFVDELMVIKDVTNEILDAMNEAKTDSAKINIRNEKIENIIENAEEKNPDLNFRVIPLYEGGKYSLYGYKRFNDIRLVFVPDLFTAKLGGDYDNFTYPRYGLDCAFLRAYNGNGEPAETPYHFSWNEEGVVENQPVFVVGNPGSTDRINTMAQVKYARDIRYPMLTSMYKDLYAIYDEMVQKDSARNTTLIARLYSIGNSLKVYNGTYKALLDPVLMARKMDFENKFKKAVQSNPELNRDYGNIWDEIESSQKELSKYAKKGFAYSLRSRYTPLYFFVAEDLIKLAEQLKLPDDEREESYKEDNLEETINNIYPLNLDTALQRKFLLVKVNVITRNLSNDNELVKKLFDGKTGQEAVDYMLSNSILTNEDSVINLAKRGSGAVLNSADPFIYFILHTESELDSINQITESLRNKDELNNQKLGEALYEVYGDTIPPDATFSLRIADGMVKGYDYNGTRAPYKTTFYGSLDRYYSFDKKFPFNLPKYWENLPEEFDLSTPLDFVSTNDIIGGNSGSPVINTKAEIVGVAFDGNIESLPSRFIYTTEANRTVSVSALGMMEAIRNLYKATRLSNEI